MRTKDAVTSVAGHVLYSPEKIRHQGKDVMFTGGWATEADAAAWIAFVRRERSLVRLLITRKVRLRGSPRLLLAFGKCFPS